MILEKIGQLPRELGRRDSPGYSSVVVQFEQLVINDPCHTLAPIADIDAPDTARGAVQILVSINVLDPGPFALNEDLRILRLKDLVLKDVMPQMFLVLLDDVFGIIVGQQVLRIEHTLLSPRPDQRRARVGPRSF